MTCNVTGTAISPNGQIKPGARISFRRAQLDVVSQEGSFVIPDDYIIQTALDGTVDFDILPGVYDATTAAVGGRTVAFRVSVPNEPAADFADLLNASYVEIPPASVTQAQQARDEAVAARVGAEAAQVAAAASAVAADASADIAAISAANAQSSSLTCATWAVLSGLTGATAGTGAEVLDTDTGTHTDPVVGGTVSNAGRYSWSASPAGWRRIGGTGLSGKLDKADFSADLILRNTSDAEIAIRAMQVADATGAVIAGRAAEEGVAWSMDAATVSQTLGLGRRPIDLMEFSRASAGSAIGGGDEAYFDVDSPRFHNGVMFLDAGGVNPVTTQDVTDSYWTKTGMNNSGASSVPGEAGATSAKRIPEDTSTGQHSIGKTSGLTIPSSDRCVYNWIVGTNRDYLQVDLFNSGSTAGVRGRFDLTGDGALVAAYPANTGSGASSPLGGVRKLGSGLFHIWLACIFPAATSAIRAIVSGMSSATSSSYTGDPAKWITVERQWATPGSLVPTSYVDETREPETLNVALAGGYYRSTITDELGAVSAINSVDFGERLTISPRQNCYTVSRADVRLLPFLDTFTRDDTADGADIGVGETATPITMLAYDSAYPMIPAVVGRIASNALTLNPGNADAKARTFYATVDIEDVGGAGWKSAFVRYKWGASVDNGGALSVTSVTIGFSTDPLAPESSDRLIENLPVHLVITRGGTSIQYRDDGAAFPLPTVGKITHTMAKDDTEHETIISIRGNTAVIRTDSYPAIVVQDEIFTQACKFAFFEITSTSGNVVETAALTAIGGAGYALEDVPAYVGAAPVPHTAAVISPATAGWAAGKLVSVSIGPGYSSNDGAGAITAYRWQYLVGSTWTDLPSPATGETYQTVDGRDEGRVISCLLTLTNNSGSTQVRSASSSALT